MAHHRCEFNRGTCKSVNQWSLVQWLWIWTVITFVVSKTDMVSSFWHNSTINYPTPQMLFNAGPPVRRWPSVNTRCRPTTTRLHLTVAYHAYTHAHNTLTVAQPCWHGYMHRLVSGRFVQASRFYGNTGYNKIGGGGGECFNLNWLFNVKSQVIIMVLWYMFVFVIFNYF